MGSEPVGVALVGAGRMGRVHLGALLIAEGVRLAGVVEPDDAVRGELETAGAPTFATLDALLESERPDGALVAAPSTRHSELVARLLAERVPVLCEKPLGVSSAAAAASRAAAEEHDVLLQVGYWRRFVPELVVLRERIAAGEFGRIDQVHCLQWDHVPPNETFRAQSGGICIDMGVHEFDQLRWLLDTEFAWLDAAPAGHDLAERAATDPDNVTVLGRMKQGAAVVVSLGRRFPHLDSCWLEIWGAKGHARVPFMWGDAGDAVFRAGMVRQAEAFAAAIRGAARSGADGRDAEAALVAAETAARSLQTGRRETVTPAAVVAGMDGR